MCAASVGPSSLNSLQILIPFINLYWVLAARGWQQCRNPNFSPLSFSLICNTTNNHILCERHFLIQGVGRWFHRFRMFETGFCPDCVRFLPFRSPQTKGHMLYKNVLLPYAISARIWILTFRIWYSNCKSHYLDKTYCKIQLIAKSNLLQNPTFFTLLEVIHLLSREQIKF